MEQALLAHARYCKELTGLSDASMLPDAPIMACTREFCSADGRFYPSRCGGDGLGTGTSGDLTTAAANGCRVIFFEQPCKTRTSSLPPC